MGQGVSLAAVGTGSASIDVKELADLTYERSLSSVRFMKCIRARHEHGLVVIKIAMRPPPDFKLAHYAKLIRRTALSYFGAVAKRCRGARLAI